MRGLVIEDSGGDEYFSASNGIIKTNDMEMFSCRAWVNFNGTVEDTTLGGNYRHIRASGNVTSVGYDGTGLYTVNFTNAMVDTDYSISGFASNNDTTNNESFVVSKNINSVQTVSACQITTTENNDDNTGRKNSPHISMQIFR
jgi:hypothetical protein